MMELDPKLVATKPKRIFEKMPQVDYKGLFKILSKGIGHTVFGKWEELPADIGETLSAIGVETKPEEIAFLLIHRSITRALFELVTESARQQLVDVNSDLEELTNQLDIPISLGEVYIDHKFFDRPAELPLLKEVQSLFQKWLELLKVSKPMAKAIADRLPSYFVYALVQEWRSNAKSYQPIINTLDTPFTKAGDREWAWTAYSALLQRRISEGIFDEPFSLSQMYIPLNAYYFKENDIRDFAEEVAQSRRRYIRVVVSLDSELEYWLQNPNPQDAIRVISGGPGSGKSTFARVFAARLMDDPKLKVLYVPLHLIDASKDLTEEIGRFVKDEGVLLQNPLDPNSSEPNLLIIFDGLDELASQGKAAVETARAFIREVERAVDKRNWQGIKLRVLISGRELIVQENETEFRHQRQILTLLPYFIPNEDSELDGNWKSSYYYYDPTLSHVDRLISRHNRVASRYRKSIDFRDLFETELLYQRRLGLGKKERYVTRAGEIYCDPRYLLDEDLRHHWWENYGALTGRGYRGLPEELNRKDLEEITAQPLLNYLVAISFIRNKLDFKKNINLNLIYADLVTAVYERGYEKYPLTYIRNIRLEDFFRVLEEIGLATWHGNGRTTTVREIEEHCKTSGLRSKLDAFQEGAKEGVTRLLLAFFFRQYGQRSSGDPTFAFTHKSFGEYLTARRIARAIERIIIELDSRTENPDRGWDERDALKHWAQISGPSAISPYLHRFLINEIKLRSVRDLAHWQERLSKLFSYVLRYGMPMENLQIGSFKDALFQARNAEEALLVALNACARVTKRVIDMEHLDQTMFRAWFKRIQAPHTGEESVLVSQCLSFLNLTGSYLRFTDFFGADLRHANLNSVQASLACFGNACLKETKLIDAQLTKANLEGAILKGAILEGAILEEAYLKGADLESANFKGANIKGANLERAILIKANIENTQLEGANLAGAILEGANLERSNLKGVNLSAAILKKANLKGANLSEARLVRTLLEGASLEGAILEKSVLEGAILEKSVLEGAILEKSVLEGAILEKSVLEGAKLDGANLMGANLERANLKGANVIGANLNETNLKGANLNGAHFEKSILEGATLEAAKLAGAYFIAANLKGANLRGAQLERANLEGANLEGAMLEIANLKEANLEDANLKKAHLIGANIEGANLEGASLEGAYLIGANFKGAYFTKVNLEGTELPVELLSASKIENGKRKSC